MSLTSFLAMPEVKAKMAVLRPKATRKIGVPIMVQPRSNHYTLVGTAFDYLIRCKIQRRAPHAVSRGLVAAYAPHIFYKLAKAGMEGLAIYRAIVQPAKSYLPPEEAAGRTLRVVVDAKPVAAGNAEQARLAASHGGHNHRAAGE